MAHGKPPLPPSDADIARYTAPAYQPQPQYWRQGTITLSNSRYDQLNQREQWLVHLLSGALTLDQVRRLINKLQ